MNKSIMCVKTKAVTLNTVRCLNLASYVPFANLEESPLLVKIWRIGFYESKEYGPIKPLFYLKYPVKFKSAGDALRIC